MEVKSVGGVKHLHLTFAPEPIKGEARDKGRNGCVNMHDVVLLLYRKISDPTSHDEVSWVNRITAPVCFPYPVESRPAHVVASNSICDGINAPDLLLEVTCD